MRIAITGGTGFIGKHLAQRLAVDGHEVVLLARGKERGEEIAGGMPMMTYVPSDRADQRVLAEAFVGCHSVAHCAGINRELGNQTFHKYMSKRQRMSSKLPNMPELKR
ncbi:MAG: NAD-dependent epimerase/dehydratase family protein [Pyrinomonadaceae bacterium]